MDKLVILSHIVGYLMLVSFIIKADEEIYCPKQCQCEKIIENNVETGLKLKCENITDIKEILFGNISSEIAYLNLTSNYISKLDHESLTGNFTKLTKFDIANNHLTNIFTGALDNLPALKYLDISANPLACDCELAWILDYTRNYSIRLKPPPKCQTPEIFRGQSLKKIRIGEDIHCSSQSASLQPQLELIPDKSQLIFEGDSLTLMCRAPRLALAPMRDHEDVAPTKSNIYWGWSEKIVHPNSKEDLTFENPTLRFPSVMIDEKLNANSGFLQSVLRIPYVTRNHSGLYDCTIQQQKGDSHISKRVSVLVISDNTKYCQAQETTSNKGSFSWPKTIRGNIVKLPCSIEGVGSSFALRRCNENGIWGEIDASGCPFTSETTRVLEQFAKMNLSIPRGNVMEAAKRLMDFTSEEYIQERFKDPLDVVFIGKTVESYLEFIHLEKHLSSYIIEIVSNVMEFPKHLLDQAQVLDRTSNKLIDAAERAASFTISSESQKHNMAIELFQIPHDVYVGISCSWERQEQSRMFLCNTASKSHPSFANIDASIQFPATQYSGSPTHRLLVSVYNNNKFFPENKSQGSYLVTSSIIGAKLVPMTPILTTLIPKNLSEPIFIALKAAPFHDEISNPKPVWWDETMNEGLGGWSFSHGCQSFHYIQGIFMFTCNRLGFYALVQHSSALNDFPNEGSGARFKLSPIGFYVGSAIIFFAAWLLIITYTMFFDQIMMGRRVKHSLINTWLSMAMLAFIFAIGIYQTENAKICQFFGVTIHYLTLCVLLWICVSVSNMYKRVSRSDRIGMEDDLPREEPRLKKPILGLYLLGYGVGLLICGINLAVNLKEYASYTHCFMDTSSELGALLLPSSILLFFLLIMFICIRFHLRNRVICSTHLSEGGTEALEIDLLESNHAVNAARSVRSFSTQPTTSVDDFEATPRTQLKSYIIVLVLYLLTWISAGVAVSIPFNERLIYEEEIFSIAFAIFSMLLGCFIVFFYGFARSDVRGIWSRFKCCGKIQKTIAPKEYEQTTTTSVLYHQPINLSRSNSQNSRGRPLSVGSIRLKMSNDCQSVDKNGGNFMMTMQRHQMSVYGDDTNTVEMFYHPGQSNAARKFFKKQKRLQKLNNIDVQKRNDFNDGSSDISSTILSVSKPVSEMFGTSSKVNNTNIHVDENKTKSKQFSNSVMSDSCNESELFMDICNEGLRFSTLKSKINNTDSKMYTNFLDNQTTIQEVLKRKIEDNKQQKSSESSKDSNPPLYVNTRSLVGKTIQEVNEGSDHDVEVAPLTVKTDPTQAMNTVGLPSPPPQKQEDEVNDLHLDRDATYISASLEISGKSDVLSPKPSFKSKSLDQLNVITSLNYHESHTRSISFNNITFIDHEGIVSSEVASSTNIEYHRTSLDRNASLSMISNQDDSMTSPPVLVAPSLCDIDQLDDQSNLNINSGGTCESANIDNMLNNHSQNGLDHTPTMLNPDNTPNFMFNASNRSPSPISFSDINYQNSELSSQDLYAPADNNDIDYMLAERDHFRISDDEDIDNGNSDFNCSRDLLIHPCQTDEDGIDQLYEQVRGVDLSNKSHKPPPPPKPKNIKVTRNYVFQYPTLLTPDDDDSSIIQ